MGGETIAYRLGRHVLFFEVILIIAVPFTIIGIIAGQIKFQVKKMDLLVLAFAYLALIPMLISFDTLYESARIYRHTVIVPFATYFVIRVLIKNFLQFQMLLVVLLVPVLIEALLLIVNFASTGIRVEDDTKFMMPKVNLSVVIAWGLAIAIFLPQITKSRISFFVKWGILLSLLTALIASAGRTATFSLIVGTMSAHFLLGRAWFKRWHHTIYYGLIICVFSGSFVFSDWLKSDVSVKSSTYEDRYSISRLSSTRQLQEDFYGRIELWKQVIILGMESPVFGRGLNFFDKDVKSKAAHSHNLYVTLFVGSGLLGLLVMVSIFTHAFNQLHDAYRISQNGSSQGIVKLTFVLGFILTFISFSNDLNGGLYPFFYLYLALVVLAESMARDEERYFPNTYFVSFNNGHTS